MNKYRLTIEGDFKKGECCKCPLLLLDSTGDAEPADYCALGGGSLYCPLEEVKPTEYIGMGTWTKGK